MVSNRHVVFPSARIPAIALAIAAGALLSGPVSAQVSGKLPAPSRTVFKCEAGGKVVYSDEPCLGAKRIDVEPTRGMDTSSGKSRTGRDVSNERFNEQFADALKPLTGETREQFESRRHRVYLEPAAQHECRQLDANVAALESDERATPPADRAKVQAKLLESRKRQREIRC